MKGRSDRYYHRKPEGDIGWMAEAACRDSDPRLFWPDQGEKIAAAIAVCAECPVREQCLDYAITNGEHDGIWGGTSARARQRLRRARRNVA